jgi:hypothetical protein
MSGGSWDYFSGRLMDVADRLCESNSALRVAFGNHLKLCADALHAIEWVDDDDCSPPHDSNAIRKALGKGWKAEVLFAAKDRAKSELKRLQVVLKECEE